MPGGGREAEVDLDALQEQLEHCAYQVRERPGPFRPTSYLLPVLEQLSGNLPSPSPLLRSLRDHPSGALLVAVASDAVRVCLLILAVLEDRDGAAVPASGGAAAQPPPPLLREEALWPGVALRQQAQRLAAVVATAAAQGQVEPGTPPAAAWCSAELLGGGASAAFWRRHFPGKLAVQADDLLAALASDYEPLPERDQAQLRTWLQPDAGGQVTVLDASVVLGAAGPWRGVLFCTAWPELHCNELRQALLSGDDSRHLALTAADLAEEARSRRRAVLLPGWSRQRLRGDRGLLGALRAVGLESVADAPEGGALLLQFPVDGVPRSLLRSESALARALREATGDRDLFACAVGRTSVAQCVAREVANTLHLHDDSARHVALSTVHARSRFKLQDDVEGTLELQRRHQVSVKRRLSCGGAIAGADGAAAEGPPKPARGAGPGARPELRAMVAENRRVFRVSALCVEALVEEALRANAEAMKPVEAAAAGAGEVLEALHEEELLGDEELELLFEVNFCMNRQVSVRKDMSAAERALTILEATFEDRRRSLSRRGGELERRVVETERELASLGGCLAAKRASGRAAADAVLDARLVLAEAMVPVPATLGMTAALEESLAAEVLALRQRTEGLQKRVAKAQAAAKKR